MTFQCLQPINTKRKRFNRLNLHSPTHTDYIVDVLGLVSWKAAVDAAISPEIMITIFIYGFDGVVAMIEMYKSCGGDVKAVDVVREPVSVRGRVRKSRHTVD